ncbi:HEAT repeat domain-containing protein [Candidatus Margulisiibacteriota bacterium]
MTNTAAINEKKGANSTAGTYNCPSAEDFRKDPKKTVKILREMLRLDFETDKSIKEYRTMKCLYKLHMQRNTLARYIKDNYNVYLKLPKNKLSLAKAKDELESFVKDHSQEHLIVLLYSITAENRQRAPEPPEWEILYDRFMRFIGMREPKERPIDLTIAVKDEKEYFKEGKKISYGKAGNIIVLTINCDDLVKSPENSANLRKVHRLVSLLNTFIPAKPVKTITIEDGTGGHYRTEEHEVGIAAFGIEYHEFIGTVAHEMGHALFAVLLAAQDDFDHHSKDKSWNNIYLHLLKNKSFEIVDDSNYQEEDDRYGHPHSSPNELFASSVASFVVHPEKLVQNINDPDTAKEEILPGKAIYCYLRDNVFKGVFKDGKFIPQESPEYAANDLLKRTSWKAIQASIDSLTKKETADIIINGLNDKNFYGYLGALKAAKWVKVKDRRLVQPLIDSLDDEDIEVRMWAVAAIHALGISDKRFIGPLGKALHIARDNDYFKNQEDYHLLRGIILETLQKLELRSFRLVAKLCSLLKQAEDNLSVEIVKTIRYVWRKPEIYSIGPGDNKPVIERRSAKHMTYAMDRFFYALTDDNKAVKNEARKSLVSIAEHDKWFTHFMELDSSTWGNTVVHVLLKNDPGFKKFFLSRRPSREVKSEDISLYIEYKFPDKK